MLFCVFSQDRSSGSDSDSEISLTGTPVDPIPPSPEEPVYVSSDPEEDPFESSEIPMQISPLRPDSETAALEPESEMPKTVSVSVGGKLAQDRDFVYSRIPELGALVDRLIRDSRQRTSVVMEGGELGFSWWSRLPGGDWMRDHPLVMLMLRPGCCIRSFARCWLC